MSYANGTLKCDNECNHGCDIQIRATSNWINQALDKGWVIQLWKTPPGFVAAHPLKGHEHDHEGHDHAHDARGNDNHALAYCDALCAYTGLRSKLMLQDDYAERIHRLELAANAAT